MQSFAKTYKTELALTSELSVFYFCAPFLKILELIKQRGRF